MIKYATALRVGTADAETILKRFTRSNFQHPTYQALLELDHAVKTVFLCRYLHEEALRRVAGKSVRKYTLRRYAFFFKGIGAKSAAFSTTS